MAGVPKTEQLLEEWKEIRTTLRYAGTKRFAQLTVFVAILGFQLDALTKQERAAGLILLAISGLAIAALFGFMEWRLERYWKKYLGRGKEIERVLKHIKLMSSHRPSEEGCRKYLTSTNAMYCLYALVASMWILVGVWGSARLYLDVLNFIASGRV